jgi:PAS domain S-box-containing protein
VISLDAIPSHRLAQLQAIYDGAPVGLCFLDRNLRYVSLNQQLARMNNVPAAAHLGRSVSEVIPDLFPLVEPYLHRALKGEAISGIEFVRPPKGSKSDSQTIVASYQPVRDEAGDVLGVSVAITDVTQRKLTEQALKESEDRYRRVMRLSPNVPWILDSRGQVIDASPRWEELTGQPMDKAMGNGWMEALHPDDVQPTIEAIHNSLRNGLPIDIHFRIRQPGHDWKRMRSRGTPRFSTSGETDSIYGVVEEMDGHQQLSEELIRCEAELRTAIDVVPEGIVIADGADGTIVMVNPQAKAIFGSSVFPGQKLAEYGLMGVLTADGRALLPNEHPLFLSIQRGEEIAFQPYTHRRWDGTYASIALASRPVRSDEGRVVGAIMMIRDYVAT